MTEKQKAFCDYYIETGNATEAAIKAGYSKKTAKVIGSENLTKPYLKQYIDERLAKIEDERIAKGEEVLQYLTRVMRGEEKDQFGLDASLQDRTKCAELLGKRYRLFVDKVESENNTTINSTKKLDSLLEQLGEDEE
ncbi:terminase small subunit [Clostridium tertium]|uniref:terminase small subunit n=1 Tax=Clostridium tertium TaxID=1559 RepID=UPI00232CBD25|nr:terminase small subunit [Clostridium tertium]MDB1956848.1 terminase small subunit [Clostridium tertium]MDB1959175.1 terminase small subunit [Clostridium tertium]MDB1963219.1 terminase small subunit [Clostridium tertium]MDB1967841.1 terminase small subunit [Clostridium tertium]